MQTAAIVQARMGSQRLPGKSLMPVWGSMSLIEMVLRRTIQIRGVDGVILATSREKTCDPLITVARHIGVSIIRGDEEDVLSRFAFAINQFGIKTVIRICADNPLIDPLETEKLIAFYNDGDLEYASNNTPESGLPDGLGCEIVSAGLITQAALSNPTADEREHVTLYVRNRSDQYKCDQLIVEDELHCPGVKLDIDTEEDLLFMREFLAKLPLEEGPLWSAQVVVSRAKRIGRRGKYEGCK
jgi:spore coat polysaccharide biosynthesis protein SpsF